MYCRFTLNLVVRKQDLIKREQKKTGTAIDGRVDHVVSNGRAEDLKAAELGSVAAVRDKLRELAGKLQVRHLANVG